MENWEGMMCNLHICPFCHSLSNSFLPSAFIFFFYKNTPMEIHCPFFPPASPFQCVLIYQIVITYKTLTILNTSLIPLALGIAGLGDFVDQNRKLFSRCTLPQSSKHYSLFSFIYLFIFCFKCDIMITNTSVAASTNIILIVYI